MADNPTDRIIVFHGADHKVGTTMLAQSVAESIAMGHKDSKILVLFLHAGTGKDYVRGGMGSLDQIRMAIESNAVTFDCIMSRCKRQDNIFLMGGIDSFGIERLFFPTAVDHIITAVKGKFDLIIIDSGNDIDCGPAIGSLRQDASKILVMTQHETVVSRFEKTDEIFKKLKIEFSGVIINKFRREDPYDAGYLSKRLGIERQRLRSISRAEHGRKAEADHMTLLRYKNDKYRADIADASKWMLKPAGIAETEGFKKGRKWIDFN